jgi:cytochrome c
MRRAVLPTLLLLCGAALGQVHPLYEGADLEVGQKLIADHQCDACHQRNVGGDGRAIYRPQGRINTPAALRGMVESCNTQLNLGMFPDEVNSVAATLNRDHYRFK